jgi:hypothetical protein
MGWEKWLIFGAVGVGYFTMLGFLMRQIKRAHERRKIAEHDQRMAASAATERREWERARLQLDHENMMMRMGAEREYTFMTGYTSAALEAGAKERLAMHVEAESKARQRLLESLTTKQVHDFHTYGYFDVRGSGGSTYRITNSGHVGNIHRLGGRGFCMHLYNGSDNFPNDDHLLAQALLIATDEVAFLKTACHL